MQQFDRNGPPFPEELQRRLSELMRQQQIADPVPATDSAAAGAPGEPTPSGEPKEFEFNFTPHQVKAHLDRFVIRQDEAKKVLSVALCDHYHFVRQAMLSQTPTNYAKQNVVLLGPTGVGKTYLIRSLADLIGVPFVKGDASKFSETGYVGGDVEDLVRELLRKADGDVTRAQYGIIYIDEIDKIASVSNSTGRDVSGRGVQTNLLKLMEETDVPAHSPMDIAGQMQAMMEMAQRGGKQGPKTINTKHILFIVSGAFPGLENVIRRRMREAVIGFAAQAHSLDDDSALLDQVQTRDFIEFGFEPEFIGRLPVRVICQPLSEGDLYDILKKSEGSIIRQYEQSFAAYGIEVMFSEDGLRRIAELAQTEQTGARGLMSVCERVFREFKFELPSTLVKRFVVTREVVDNPVAALANLLKVHQQEEQNIARKLVHEFSERFREAHGLNLRFTDEAADRLIAQAAEQRQPIREWCAAQFKDYQFGLKLISQNTGQTEFLIETGTVEEPAKALSDWVVASYRQNAGGTPTA